MDLDDVRVFHLTQNFNFILEERVARLPLRTHLLHDFRSILLLGLLANGDAHLAEAALANDVTKSVEARNVVYFLEAIELFPGRARLLPEVLVRYRVRQLVVERAHDLEAVLRLKLHYVLVVVANTPFSRRLLSLLRIIIVQVIAFFEHGIVVVRHYRRPGRCVIRV